MSDRNVRIDQDVVLSRDRTKYFQGKLIQHGVFLAVQDSSISDIVGRSVGLSVGLSEPTNNQSLGRLLRDCSDTTVTLQ